MSAIQVNNVTSQLQSMGYDASPTAVLVDAFNAAYKRIAAMRRWKWQYASAATTLASGQSTVAVASLSNVDAVRLTGADGNGYAPSYMPWHELRALAAVTDLEGTPRYWSYDHGYLSFDSVADQSYTVDVDGLDTGQTFAAGNTTDMPERFQSALLWAAVVPLAFRQRDYQGAQVAEGQFQTLIADLVRQDGISQRQGRLEVSRHPVWEELEL